MTATETFIKDAVEGGWKLDSCEDADMEEVVHQGIMYYWHRGDGEVMNTHHHSISEILLDPLAWQAVGKIRGWDKEVEITPGKIEPVTTFDRQMHSFIDHLAAGDDIERALSKIV
jgi:hypothetical protein